MSLSGKNLCDATLPNALDRMYICNPNTGRWVLKNGDVGLALIHQYGEINLENYSRGVNKIELNDIDFIKQIKNKQIITLSQSSEDELNPSHKTCGETQLEILQDFASIHHKKFFISSMLIKNKHNILQYVANKLPIDELPISRIDTDDLQQLDFNISHLSLYDIVQQIINTVNTQGIVGIDLAMGGEYSDFYHCFIISKDYDNKYLLSHTYFGEIDDRVSVPFYFSKFLELLETGKQELWTDIFNVDEQESGSDTWNMIITELSN